MLFCLCFLIQYLVCHSFTSKEQVSFNFMDAVILEFNKIKFVTSSTFSPSICDEVMGLDAMILVFGMLSFKPAFSFSSFSFIERLFSSSLLSAIGVVSSAYPEKAMAPHSSTLAWKIHGQRSLVGCSPWGR